MTGSGLMVERTLDPSGFRRAEGHLWWTEERWLPWGDGELLPDLSRLELLEDGHPLGPAHSLHAEVATAGGGRYSHWGRALFFSSSDGSPPPANGRRYTVRFERPVPEEALAHLLVLAGRLGHERPVDRAELKAVLGLPDPAARAYVFEQLGSALLFHGRQEAGIEQLCRAWRLGRTPGIEACVAALKRQGAFSEVWDLTARAALAAVETGNADLAAAALLLRHDAIYTAYAQGAPHPGYQDPVVVASARNLLARRRPPLPPSSPGGRVRVGYLLAGETGTHYSSLPDIVLDIVLGHDRACVEPLVLTLHSPEALAGSPFSAERSDRLQAAGIPLLHVGTGTWSVALADVEAAARAVADMGLDALVVTVLTGHSALLTMLRPARRILSLGLGEIHMYTSADVDLTVHFSPKPAMDAFSPSIDVVGFVPSSRMRPAGRALPRAALGVPDGAFALLASGRAVKFRSPLFWRLAEGMLRACDRLHLVLCGIDAAFVDGLEAPLPPDLRGRVHALGWRNDIFDVYRAIDAVIDTVPNGGGYSLYEPMNLGIPAIGFHDNPLKGFQEETWMPAMEQLDLPEATFDPTDEAGIVAHVHRLATDPAFHVLMGEKARTAVQRWRDPGPVVRALECAILAEP